MLNKQFFFLIIQFKLFSIYKVYFKVSSVFVGWSSWGKSFFVVGRKIFTHCINRSKSMHSTLIFSILPQTLSFFTFFSGVGQRGLVN